MTITRRDIDNEIAQALDGSDRRFNVGALQDAFFERYGLVSIESVDHDEFWALVGEHDVTDQTRPTRKIAFAHGIMPLAEVTTVEDMIAEHGRDTIFFPAVGNYLGGLRPEFEAEFIRRAKGDA